MLGFAIWAAVGCCLIGLGLYSFAAEKPVAFWANAKMFEVNDVRGYNLAVGKCWCVFGAVFVALGAPLLAGQNSPGVLLSVAGVMIECIAFMAVYTLVIEKRYRKRH